MAGNGIEAYRLFYIVMTSALYQCMIARCHYDNNNIINWYYNAFALYKVDDI